jgi:hypothetical protein
MEKVNWPEGIDQLWLSDEKRAISLARTGKVRVWDSPAAYFSLQKPRRFRTGWVTPSGKVMYWKEGKRARERFSMDKTRGLGWEKVAISTHHLSNLGSIDIAGVLDGDPDSVSEIVQTTLALELLVGELLEVGVGLEGFFDGSVGVREVRVSIQKDVDQFSMRAALEEKGEEEEEEEEGRDVRKTESKGESRLDVLLVEPLVVDVDTLGKVGVGLKDISGHDALGPSGVVVDGLADGEGELALPQ